MRTAVLGLGTVLFGCGHPASSAKPITLPIDTPVSIDEPRAAVAPVPPPAVPWLPKADLVVAMEGGELVGWSLAGTPAEVGRTRIVDADAPAWGLPEYFDKEHVVVQTDDDRGFVLLGATASVRLEVPAKERFAKFPAPKTEDPNPPEASSDGFIAFDAGKIVYKQCVWGWPYDGFQCGLMAVTTVWPADPAHAIVQTEIDGYDDPIDHGWVDATAKVFAIARSKDDRPTCKTAKGTTVTLAKPGAPELRLLEVKYVDGAAIVMFGSDGLDGDEPAGFQVYTACGDKPILTGERYHLYPGQLWIASDDNEGGDRVFRGTKMILQVPDNHGFAVRP